MLLFSLALIAVCLAGIRDEASADDPNNSKPVVPPAKIGFTFIPAKPDAKPTPDGDPIQIETSLILVTRAKLEEFSVKLDKAKIHSAPDQSCLIWMDTQVAEFKTFALGDRETTIIASPCIVALSGQQAQLKTGSENKPEIDLKLLPVWDSANHKIQLSVNQVVDVPLKKTSIESNEVRIVAKQGLTVELSDGQTIAFGPALQKEKGSDKNERVIVTVTTVKNVQKESAKISPPKKENK